MRVNKNYLFFGILSLLNNIETYLNKMYYMISQPKPKFDISTNSFKQLRMITRSRIYMRCHQEISHS